MARVLFPAVVALSGWLLPAAGFADPRPIDDVHAGTLSIYFENDLFTGTDRYYTNGAKVSWTSPDLEKFSDEPSAQAFVPILRSIPFINNPEMQKNVAFSIGQNIYTPDNTESAAPVPGDRPYAGWLYLGLGLIWKNAETRNSLVLNVGVVGPWSLAEEAQRYVHEARQLAVPDGWDNQLGNEVGVVLVYEHTWRWFELPDRVGPGWDLLPHAGIAVGNVQDYVNAGAEFRVGVNLPDDFGTSTIGPAATTSTPVEGNQQAGRLRAYDLGAYFFLSVDGRVVAHNIFLDGNTFEDSVSVERNWFVADLSAGASINYKNTTFTYAVVYRTEEFATQKAAQLFGAISLNFAF